METETVSVTEVRMPGKTEDDFAAYFDWKELAREVEREGGRGEGGGREEEGEDTVANLSRRLSSLTTQRRKGRKKQGKKEEEEKYKMPVNRQVDLMTKGKAVDIADEGLLSVRRQYQVKMVEFAERWQRVESGQLEVKQNLVKFNNFVREKQGKVDGGLARAREEQEEQARRQEELQQLREEAVVHERARAKLGEAAEARRDYSAYLESVVSCQPGTYPDIRSLMERCQALLATRDGLRQVLDTTVVATDEEARSLEKFKEQKMGQTLAYNVRLADLQQTYSGLAAKTLERNTFVQNIEDKKAEKRLLISNIKLAILNMHKYACRRAVALPGDKEDAGGERALTEQLANIFSHIEDLGMVNTRVRESDLAQGYLDPLASDKSELRLDY